MRKWIFYPVLASAGFVLPVVVVNVASAETAAAEKTPPAAAAEKAMGDAAEATDDAARATDDAARATDDAMDAAGEAMSDASGEQPAAVKWAVSAPPPPDTMATSEYVVKPGDTLGDIARRHLGSVNEWHRIADLNGIDDPAKLAVGTRLELPAPDPEGS